MKNRYYAIFFIAFTMIGKYLCVEAVFPCYSFMCSATCSPDVTPIRNRQDACPLTFFWALNFRCWVLLRVFQEKANISSSQGLVYGCTRRNIEKRIIPWFFGYLLGVTKSLSHAQIEVQGSTFKTYDDHPHLFPMGVPSLPVFAHSAAAYNGWHSRTSAFKILHLWICTSSVKGLWASTNIS